MLVLHNKRLPDAAGGEPYCATEAGPSGLSGVRETNELETALAMPLVVDCSVAAAWALADERTPWTAAALQTVTIEGGLAPSLFWFEIRNILVVNERRGRINPKDSDQFLADLGAIIRFDIAPVDAAVISLARAHNLTVYDATFLELAQRRAIPLATLDRELIGAASQINVELWQP